VVVQGDEAEAGLSRISQAFGRLEQREPSMVLRRTHMALIDMGASALGAQTQLGRLAISFAGLAGPEGLAAVAIIGALGLGFKELGKAGDQAAADVEASANRMHAAIGKALGEGFGSERRAAFTSSIADARLRLATLLGAPVTPDTVAIGETGGGELFPSADLAGAKDTRADQIANLNTAIGQLTVGLATIDRESEKAAEAGLRKLREELSGINAEISIFMAGSVARGTLPAQDILSRIKVPTLAQLQGAETARQVNLGGTKQVVDAIGVSLLGVGRGETADIVRGPDARPDRNAEKLASVIGREIGPLISAFSGGGARGAVSGAGGIAATLASLNDPKTGKALLGSAAPWLSLAGGVLSGITSLFGGSKPKVIISAFEEEAARQIKELRSDPATTQFVLIGPDARGTQQQLNRLNRMGVISRLPR